MTARYPVLVRRTVRKAGYPTLVRAHVRGSQIDPAALTELRTWFNAHPDIRACEAGDHRFDPFRDPGRYLAAELAEPDHADLRGKPVDVTAIRQWERQEANHHDQHDHPDVVAKEQPRSAAVHVDTPSGDLSVADRHGREAPLVVTETETSVMERIERLFEMLVKAMVPIEVHNHIETPEVHNHVTVAPPKPRAVRVEIRDGVKRFIPE